MYEKQIMRVCLSFLVVELMRLGQTPQTACVQGIQRLMQLHSQETVIWGWLRREHTT